MGTRVSATRGLAVILTILLGGCFSKTCDAQDPARSYQGSRSSVSPLPVLDRRPLETIRFTFDPREDKNFDKWPDEWKRYRGVGYPTYVSAELVSKDPIFDAKAKRVDQSAIEVWRAVRTFAIAIDEAHPWLAAPSVFGPRGIPLIEITRIPSLLHWLPSLPPSVANLILDGVLQVELDGGQFKAQSAVMPSSELYQYRMSCRIHTQGLRHDSVRFELVFVRNVGTDQDPQIKELMTVGSPPVRGNHRSIQPVIELVQPPPQTTGMIARLIVQRSEDGLEDIRGLIQFDDLRIEKHPQLMITSDRRLGIYSIEDPITVESKVLGLHHFKAMVHFQLVDSENQLIEESMLPITPTVSEGRGSHATLHWAPKPPGPGFFTVFASIKGLDTGGISAKTTIAVVDPVLDGTPHGPFGWTMPRNSLGVSPRQYSKWLAQMGVAWIKYPCWIDSEDTSTLEETAALLTRVQDSGIETVGMLDKPPLGQIQGYGIHGRNEMVVAQLFRDIDTWKPELELTMNRLTLKVRRWQLGADHDDSFVGRPRLKETIEHISKGLQGYGQPISMTINWPWIERQLPHQETSWQAVCRGNHPSMQAGELDRYLRLIESNPRSVEGPATWVLLDPSDSTKYSHHDRIRDLMLRMATVRSHRVEAAFVSAPFDPKLGLLDAKGRPGDLLLPWRTTSRLIGNLRKVGSLKLKGGSPNIVFAGANRAVVMMWSAKPRVEKLFFGEQIKQVDAMGRIKELTTVTDVQQPHQVIHVGPVPTFIVGVDPMLIAFRMSVDVEPTQFDALLGETQQLKVHFTNPLKDSIIGSMRVFAPKAWTFKDHARTWEALGGRSTSESFEVTLGNTATIGQDLLPIQFEFDTIPPRKITVYRKVRVGPEGLDVKITTRLFPSGELQVRIQMINHSNVTQSYNALLFAPGRQYHSTFLTIKGNETLHKDIYFADGEELVGRRMTLRAIEQDGNRVLNYTFDGRR